MKQTLTALALIAILSACDTREVYEITVSNPAGEDRTDEVIALNRDSIAANLPDYTMEKLLALSHGEEKLPFQLDDLDGDGEWDEMVFMTDLAAGENKKFQLEITEDTSRINPVVHTNVRFAKIVEKNNIYEEMVEAERLQGTETKITSQQFQFEGPGWENDKVAFRNYFDERNGIDIFGKTTDQMVLDKVGIDENYHEMQDWGMDILKVGNSLGAGALAIAYQDSLIRVTAPDKARFKSVAEGPYRSIFDFTFDEIALNEASVSLTHRIKIVAGQYGYQSEVIIENKPPEAQLVTGIVNLQSDTSYLMEENQVAILYTHDRQSYNEEQLGMAIMTPKSNYNAHFETPEQGAGIVSTYAMEFAPADEITFHFLAGWEVSDEQFATKEGFEDYLSSQAEKLANPVEISY